MGNIIYTHLNDAAHTVRSSVLKELALTVAMPILRSFDSSGLFIVAADATFYLVSVASPATMLHLFNHIGNILSFCIEVGFGFVRNLPQAIEMPDYTITFMTFS